MQERKGRGCNNNLPHRHPIPSANCRLRGALAPLTNLFLQVTGALVREMTLLSLTILRHLKVNNTPWRATNVEGSK